MNTDGFFNTQKPTNQFIASIVDYYFYIDIPVSQLAIHQEFIIPFPRITFGYFFNHPFTVTNHTLNLSASVNMVISRISTHKITVQPQSDRIKILGAHVKPYCLAYLTDLPIRSMPWLINTMDLFHETGLEFQQRIELCQEPEQMFMEVERVFSAAILHRDLSLIIKTLNLIENKAGSIQLSELSRQVGVSERTIRNQFYDHIGCSPKEYLRLVKLRQVAYQMKYSQASLTSITYTNDYFDQAHFIHEVKNLTGKSPNELRKEIPDFRFLQF